MKPVTKELECNKMDQITKQQVHNNEIQVHVV